MVGTIFLMVPSESAPQELSNDKWSCQFVSTILNLGKFCVPALATEVTISPERVKKTDVKSHFSQQNKTLLGEQPHFGKKSFKLNVKFTCHKQTFAIDS
jgi:hypothetical protein